MKQWTTVWLIIGLAILAPTAGRSDEPASKEEAKEEQTKLDRKAKAAIELFKKTDPEMKKLFDDAAGFAVIPSVVKAAVGIGAAHGKGQVYTKGKPIGTASMTQITIGVQLGGQEYAEVIFFETKEALDRFVGSEWEMSAQATAVAAANGAAANAKYKEDVAVFTVAKSGLMFEASVGGQKFKFTPRKDVPKY